MSIDEYRIKEFFLFYLFKRAERSESTLQNSSLLLSTGSSPELTEGSRSTLIFFFFSHDRRARRRLRFASYKIGKAQRHQYWRFRKKSEFSYFSSFALNDIRRLWDRNSRSLTFYEIVNIERPTSNNVFCQFKKKVWAKQFTLRNSLFVIRYSAVRCLARLAAAKAASLIIKTSGPFGVVPYVI